MLRSLVGSEMCIRDRVVFLQAARVWWKFSPVERARSTRLFMFFTACFSDFAVGDKVWMQHHATKKWYKTAIITEIRHGGRAYLVTDQDGQLYVRGRRFLRLDDRNNSSNELIRAVHSCTLSPFSGVDPSISSRPHRPIASLFLPLHKTHPHLINLTLCSQSSHHLNLPVTLVEEGTLIRAST